jgi:hypothetical protein
MAGQRTKRQAPKIKPDFSHPAGDLVKRHSASKAGLFLRRFEFGIWGFSGAWRLVLGAFFQP